MSVYRRIAAILGGALVAASPVVVGAHSGPPFPIVSDRTLGAYRLSIWTDPDTTDDGSAAGQFWVMLQPADTAIALPAETRATVSVTPADGRAGETTRRTEPVNGDATRQFAALVLDHEGPFTVHVSVEGPLGRAELGTAVDATYDARPAPGLVVVYLMPFVLVGWLWGRKLLQRRRRRGITGAPRAH
jgi:hypothetical protein